MSSLGGDVRFLPLLSGCAHPGHRVSNPPNQALFLKGDDELALTCFVGIGPRRLRGAKSQPYSPN